MLVTIFFFLGIATLPICIWAAVTNFQMKDPESPSCWRYVRWMSWVVGVLLAILAIFLSYPIAGGGDLYRVFGIPFVAYCFDHNGFDYVGALTLPTMVINFVYWTVFPQLVIRVYAFHTSRHRVTA